MWWCEWKAGYLVGIRSIEFGGLDCILNIIWALRMGSCFSALSPVRKRKPFSRNSSFDYGHSHSHRREEQLHRDPNRTFLNGSTHIASLFSQQGMKGINQDAMIVWEVNNLNPYFPHFWTPQYSTLLMIIYIIYLLFLCLFSVYHFSTSKFILVLNEWIHSI